MVKEEGLKWQVVAEAERKRAPQSKRVLAAVTAAFWEFPEGAFWKG